MCYSKEVSLSVGLGMIAVTSWSWWRYARVVPSIPPDPAPPREPGTPQPMALRNATRSMLLGHYCLAGHQLFEAAALQWQSDVLYKVGLVVSILCMVFLMRSLEQLTRVRYSVGLFGLVVAALAVHVATRDVVFSNREFWVRGEDHAVWGVGWIALFFYWNVCIREARKDTAVAGNRRLLRAYGWAILNVSFVLSLAYALLAVLAQDVAWAARLWEWVPFAVPLGGHDVIDDLPSIWCVFSGMQVLFVPFLLSALYRSYRVDSLPSAVPLPAPERLWLVVKTAVFVALLYALCPLLRDLALKLFTN